MDPASPLQSSASDLTLQRWRLFDLPDGARHAVGFSMESQRERVTPALVELDARTLCARSTCGRVYRLEGAPDEGSTAAYVWTWFAAQSRMGEWRDSTQDVWDAHKRTAASVPGATQP